MLLYKFCRVSMKLTVLRPRGGKYSILYHNLFLLSRGRFCRAKCGQSSFRFLNLTFFVQIKYFRLSRRLLKWYFLRYYVLKHRNTFDDVIESMHDVIIEQSLISITGNIDVQ